MIAVIAMQQHIYLDKWTVQCIVITTLPKKFDVRIATEFSMFVQNVNHASEKHRTLQATACKGFFLLNNIV